MLSKTNQEDQNTLIIANESDTSTASTNEDNNGTFLLEVKKDTMIKEVIDENYQNKVNIIVDNVNNDIQTGIMRCKEENIVGTQSRTPAG